MAAVFRLLGNSVLTTLLSHGVGGLRADRANGYGGMSRRTNVSSVCWPRGAAQCDSALRDVGAAYQSRKGSNSARRDEFVRNLLGHDAILTSRAYLARSQPTIVFTNLTDSEHKMVVSALIELGRWCEDAQFKSMDKP